MRTIFVVEGPLIWLDDKGEADGYFDVHMYIAMCKAHYDKVGLGAGMIDAILR
jgi:2,4'-dihydroxyacetophenone dioxygenase